MSTDHPPVTTQERALTADASAPEWTPPDWDDDRPGAHATGLPPGYRLTGNVHDAGDLTHDVSSSGFSVRWAPTPRHLRGLAADNVFLDKMRRKQRIRFDALSDEAAAPDQPQRDLSRPSSRTTWVTMQKASMPCLLSSVPPSSSATSRDCPAKRWPTSWTSSSARCGPGSTAAGPSCWRPWPTAPPPSDPNHPEASARPQARSPDWSGSPPRRQGQSTPHGGERDATGEVRLDRTREIELEVGASRCRREHEGHCTSPPGRRLRPAGTGEGWDPWATPRRPARPPVPHPSRRGGPTRRRPTAASPAGGSRWPTRPPVPRRSRSPGILLARQAPPRPRLGWVLLVTGLAPCSPASAVGCWGAGWRQREDVLHHPSPSTTQGPAPTVGAGATTRPAGRSPTSRPRPCRAYGDHRGQVGDERGHRVWLGAGRPGPHRHQQPRRRRRRQQG